MHFTSVSRILCMLRKGSCGNHLSGYVIAYTPQADTQKLFWHSLHRIGVFHRTLLPTYAVSFYLTLFTLASFVSKTFRVFAATIGGMVSVTPLTHYQNLMMKSELRSRRKANIGVSRTRGLNITIAIFKICVGRPLAVIAIISPSAR